MTPPIRGTDPAHLSDRELMALASDRSLEELYDRYCARAYRVARAVCRDDGRAQDAVQDGFVSVWNSRASYRPENGTVAAWLLTVVRHRAIDLARRDRMHTAERESDDRLASRPAPDDLLGSVVKRDEAERLQASLAMLPDAQQEVIMLAYYGQLSHTEIAAQLGLPAGTIKGRMRLGLHKLRADLKQAAA
jgi:RNA polymerase sigma-70 factor (ECF subfamily)